MYWKRIGGQVYQGRILSNICIYLWARQNNDIRHLPSFNWFSHGKLVVQYTYQPLAPQRHWVGFTRKKWCQIFVSVANTATLDIWCHSSGCYTVSNIRLERLATGFERKNSITPNTLKLPQSVRNDTWTNKQIFSHYSSTEFEETKQFRLISGVFS